MNIKINNGVVTKDGEELGMIEGGTCQLERKIGPTVKAAINEEFGAKLKFIVNADDDSDEEIPPLATMSDDDLAAEMKRRGLIQYAPPQPPTVPLEQADIPPRDISAVERLHALAQAGKIPSPPAKHPAMGDKTPEYVAWFKAHATPAEIEIRYPAQRKVPASAEQFAAAQSKLAGKLPGEKKDTNPENDFTKGDE